MTGTTDHELTQEGRLLSLDAYRGMTMLLLVNGGLFSYLAGTAFDDTILHTIFQQFEHPEWIGLRFWDLVQPFFMFIVGVAMPFSLAKRLARGDSQKQLLLHVVKRSLLLLFLGVSLSTQDKDHFVLYFQNVLAQLSVCYLVAYLMMRKPAKVQISFSIVLIVLTEVIYRVFPIAGFDQPFVRDHNFGTWFDQVISSGSRNGWVSINAIPTTAHTIWGVLAGQVLMSAREPKQKI
jgi:predicted acyltransferase